MHIDKLKHGREQPFYHVLPDTRDRPGAATAYVPHELLLLDTPPEPLQHPLTSSLFERFDAASGRYIPKVKGEAPTPGGGQEQDRLSAEVRAEKERSLTD
jgi:heat shock protein HspQ